MSKYNKAYYEANKLQIRARQKKYEAKVTDKTQITITKAWLEKLEMEANRAHEEPVFVFGFEGSKLVNVNWGAVPLERLEELFQIEAKYMEEQ